MLSRFHELAQAGPLQKVCFAKGKERKGRQRRKQGLSSARPKNGLDGQPLGTHQGGEHERRWQRTAVRGDTAGKQEPRRGRTGNPQAKGGKFGHIVSRLGQAGAS
jgi:hypothetical protein